MAYSCSWSSPSTFTLVLGTEGGSPKFHSVYVYPLSHLANPRLQIFDINRLTLLYTKKKSKQKLDVGPL